MVSARCRTAVKQEMTALRIPFEEVQLGEVTIAHPLSPQEILLLQTALQSIGLELIEDKKIILVQHIKNLIIQLVHSSDDQLAINLSDYLGQQLHHNYTYLATVFSETQGITIEKFTIALKIERIKELIGYDELTLTEIAAALHYSSIAHLSNQFKKETGLSPSVFRKLKTRRRVMIELL